MVKIFLALCSSKLFALYLGPSGMALVGNLRNFMTSAEGIATLGIQNGIVKYTAENQDSHANLKRIFSTALVVLVTMAVLCAIFLVSFTRFWDALVFEQHNGFSSVFYVLAAALPFYAASLYLISALNGLGRFRRLIFANIVGNVLGFFLSAVLVVAYGLHGALISVVLSPALLFLGSLYFLGKSIALKDLFSLKAFDFAKLKNFSAYTMMALFSALSAPVVYLAIRQKLIVVSGIEAAGLWEAMSRISSHSLMFVTTLVTVYYLPKLSLAKNNWQLGRIFRNYFKSVIPWFVLAMLFVFVLRKILIQILFTDEFLEMEELFPWQLFGDVFKAASLILGYCFFARRNTKAFLFTEIFSLAVLYSSSLLFMAIAGVKGVVAAYAFTYCVYFVVLLVYYRKPIWATKKPMDHK